MTDLSSTAENVLLAVADGVLNVAPGVAVPLSRIAGAAELEPEECWKTLGILAQRQLVGVTDTHPRAANPNRFRGARLTETGKGMVEALGVLPPEGPVDEFVGDLDDLQRLILDSVTEWLLKVAGGAASRSHVRTLVRNQISPRPDIDSVSRRIDSLVGTHIEVLGGAEPFYRITLRGLLGSRWGANALGILDRTFESLRQWKNAEPSLMRYSWGRLRKANSLPMRALNLTYLAITTAKLGQGLFQSEGDKWWTTPPDVDVLLENASVLDYVRSVLQAETATAAWTQLSPHRPLRQGDPQYAVRPNDGGKALADAVLAGWRRIAVVGPMGVGKSTELAAAEKALDVDRFVFRINIDATFDMHHVRSGEVFAHVLASFLEKKPNPTVEDSLKAAEDLRGERRDVRRDLALRALRSAGRATLLIDGLEKANEEAARAVAEEFFALGDEAEVVLVVPVSLAYGPGASVLGDDVRLFAMRPVLAWGEPHEVRNVASLFLREVALRHLQRGNFRPDRVEAELVEIIDAAGVASGGVPRVLLQLLRDAHRQAVIARRSVPSLADLERAKADHGEYLRRSLVAGDTDVLSQTEGRDGSEVPLERKLRFLLQGLLLEYRRGDRTFMHVAPTLAAALQIEQVYS